MTRSYKTKGIIIRRVNVGEADRLLDLYTPLLGKIRVKAKGVRRTKSKLAGHLEIFSEVDLVLSKGKSIDIITAARALDNFQVLRDTLKKTAVAYYFCELVYWLTEEGYKDTELYNLLWWALETLVEVGDESLLPLFVANVELLLLDRLGYRPELAKCADTGRKLDATCSNFSPQAGGVVTKETRGSIKIDSNSIKVLRIMVADKISPIRWNKIPQKNRQEVKKVVREFVHYTLEKRLNTEGFLELTQRYSDL